MKMNAALLVAATLSALALGACASKEEKAAPPAPPTAREQAMNQLQADRDAYIQRTDAKVAQYQQHADQLRAQAATQQKPMNKKLSNAAEDLDSSLRDVKNALNEVRSVEPQNWLDYKRDVEKAINRADAQYATSSTLLK